MRNVTTATLVLISSAKGIVSSWSFFEASCLLSVMVMVMVVMVVMVVVVLFKQRLMRSLLRPVIPAGPARVTI